MGNESSKTKIYLFGDSLTFGGAFPDDQGWAWRLQEYYGESAEVCGRGVPGATTASSLGRFQRNLIEEFTLHKDKPDPLFVTIFLGANDACLEGNIGTLVPRDKFKEHINFYIRSLLLTFNSAKVILITTPTIDAAVPLDPEDEPDEEKRMALCRQSRGHRTWKSKRDFSEACKEVGKDYEDNPRFAVLDFWRKLNEFECGGEANFLEMDANETLPGCGLPGSEQFKHGVFTDGLHFAPKAQELLYRELLDLITEKWPELKHDKSQSAA